MTKVVFVTPPVNIPQRVLREFHCRNGLAASCAVPGASARSLQHVYGWRRKQVFSRSANLMKPGAFSVSSDSGPAVGPATWYPIHFHTGFGANRLVIKQMVLPTNQSPDFGFGTRDSRLQWSLRDVSGALISTSTMLFTPRAPEGRPMQITEELAMQGELQLFVDEDTTYTLDMQIWGGARPLYTLIHESTRPVITLADDAVADDSAAYDKNIVAEDYAQLFDAADKLRRRNGQPIFSFTRDTTANSAPGELVDIWVNPFPGGFEFDLNAEDFISERGVPVRLAVRGHMVDDPTGGSAGLEGVRLIDSNDVVLVEFSGWTTTEEWRSEEFWMKDLTGPVKIQIRGTGLQIFRLDAVHLYRFGDPVISLPVIALPASASEWSASYSTIPTPDGIWTFQESAPSPTTDPAVFDQVGSNDLFQTSNPTYQDASDDGTFRVILDSNDSLKMVSTAAFDADGATNISGIISVKIPSTTVGTKYIGGKATSSAGYSIRYISGSQKLQLWYNPNSGGNILPFVDANFADDQEHLIGFALQLTGTKKVVLYSDLGNSGEMSVSFNATVAVAFALGLLAGLGTSQDFADRYLALWDNHFLTASQFAQLVDNLAT